jgi:ribosome modulation factor
MSEVNASELAIRDARRRELEQTSFARNANGGAVMMPSNGRELMDMANMMAQSGPMVRDFYRNNPGACAALIMVCAPYGLNPILSSWKTYRASKGDDAPISFEAQFINAMINQSAPIIGRLVPIYEGEGVSRVCVLSPKDRATGEILHYKTPPIGSITVKNSPSWKSDPDQQLFYYASRAWARRYFPELLLGIYSREEIEDSALRDVTPAEDRQNSKPSFGQMAIQARKEAAGPTDDQPAQEEAAAEEDQSETISPALAAPDVAGLDPMQAEAKWLGVTDFRSGAGRDQCPFPEGEPLREFWLAGWDHAKGAAS